MSTKKMSLTAITLASMLAGAATAAAAEPTPAEARADVGKAFGFVPGFIKQIPDAAVPGVWEQLKTLQMNPNTALSGKAKELIGLAVSAQVPCKYCVYAHTEFAKLNGANQTEVGEAVAMGGIIRHWSTFLNGMQIDDGKFRGEIARLVENVKKSAGAPPPARKPIDVVDGKTANQQMEQMLGFVPEFIGRFPDAARAGAWREMRDVQLNPKTALDGKTKELIGLAVAGQVPCKYCVFAHTEFAKLNGATDKEITEAVAMGALTRNMSTLLNGLQIDEPAFKRDIDRVVQGARKAAKAATPATTSRKRMATASVEVK